MVIKEGFLENMKIKQCSQEVREKEDEVGRGRVSTI